MNFIIKILICLTFASPMSCAASDRFNLGDMNQEVNLTAYPQKWQLVKMTGQMRDSKTTGDDMSWQEYYLLDSDGTFVKMRKQRNKVTESKGKYTFVSLSDGKYLKLTHQSGSIIIGNCSSDLIEHIRVDSDHKISATWFACDGPGLVYQRVH